MNNQPTVITERIDDVVLLLHVMMQIGLPELLNRNLPRHWHQKGLDWGWVAVIWLSYILSQGDHRKVMVREWVNNQRNMLEQVCGIEIRETNFTDDRLGIVLRRLSSEETWAAIETELTHNSIRVYDLSKEVVWMDATTMSGHHLVSESGLFQWGHSKDDPTLAQIKVMMASLDPLGMPVATQVVSGENADDGLYIPMFERVKKTLLVSQLLWVGDCKMSAHSIRAHIHLNQHYYLTPLAKVGKVPAQLILWMEQALKNNLPKSKVCRIDEKGVSQVIATGYELSRIEETIHNQQDIEWAERVLLLHSPVYAQQQQRGLEKRLQAATEKLIALTPKQGRGKRQIREQALLHQTAQAILKIHRVEDMLSYSYLYHSPTTKTPLGRYQITSVEPNLIAIAAVSQTFGWRVYVTNAPMERPSFEDAVLTYRDEWIAERGFHRFKGKSLSITPLFVQRDDQVQGLVHLLSLGLRLLTEIEFVVRRRLEQSAESLVGLHPENPPKTSKRPTTERLLKAFDNITFTILEVRGQHYGHITPLTPLQEKILHLLGLSSEIYSGLAESPG